MPHRPKLGILAGGGALPSRIAEACRLDGRDHFVLVFENQGDPDGFAESPLASVRLGAGGAAIKRLREEGCEDLVMAGTIQRPSLKELRPDLWDIKFFASSGAAALGDDGLLSALVRALEGEGFNVVGAHDILPDLLLKPGPLGRYGPSEDDMRDISAAIRGARELGARDMGQAAVADDGEIIAEESTDGTDAMLRTLAERGNGGGVLAKTLKPGQERRADLPTIGPQTVENAHAAGLIGIVAEAGNAILMDEDATRARADALRLFVVGVEPEA